MMNQVETQSLFVGRRYGTYPGGWHTLELPPHQFLEVKEFEFWLYKVLLITYDVRIYRFIDYGNPKLLLARSDSTIP